MVNESPAVVLFNRDGYDVVITDGYTIISGQPGILMAGKNGSTAKFITLDINGNQVVVGPGTAGSPSGGVITIQGIGSGTPVTVSQSGTWNVSQVTSPWITIDTIADGYLQSILANQTNGTQHTIVDGYVQTNPNVIVTNFPAIQAVSQSGTWTIQQGTPPWSVIGTSSDNTINPITKLSVIVAKANTANPSWTDGYQAPLSVTTDGYLRVLTRQGTSPWVDNITQFGSTNISTGTGTSGAGIPRVTVSNDSNILATQSGTWTVQQGSAPWINKDGYVTTAAPTYINNTNNYLSLTTTGLLRVDGSNVTQPVSQSGTWTVQQGTPPWTITGIASDNTTNSTAKLPVLPARANTSPPSWTDGYQVPLSTLLTGALRSDVTSWMGSTAPTIGQKTMANSIPVTMASDQLIQLTGIVDNNAFTDGTTRVQPTGYIFDEVAGTALTENDAAAARIDSKRAQIMVIEDGINRGTRVSVKNASTAPVAADPALVVSFSPNSLFGDNTTNTTVKLPVLPAIAKASPPSWTDGYQIPLSTLLTGALRTDNTSWFGSTAPTVGQKTKANSIPVVFPSDQSISVTLVNQGATTGIVAGILQLGGASAGTLNAVRATAYIEQATNGQRSVKSSSASDTAAGVGLRVMEITYFDQDGYGPYVETLTLNGTTAVATVATNICFIEKMAAKTVGSSLRNIGTISLFSNNSGGGTLIGTIGIGNLIASQGDNQTLWAHHYVPNGKVAKLATYIVSAESGGSGTNATYFLRQEPIPSSPNDAEIVISDLLIVIGPLVRQLGIPIKSIGPCRITAYGIPGGNGVRLNASFDFSEETL